MTQIEFVQYLRMVHSSIMLVVLSCFLVSKTSFDWLICMSDPDYCNDTWNYERDL